MWEWCLSEYKKPEVKPQLDARKEKLGTDKRRVLRGGSWFDDFVVARAADRYDLFAPGSRFNYIGFRVAFGRPPSFLL